MKKMVFIGIFLLSIFLLGQSVNAEENVEIEWDLIWGGAVGDMSISVDLTSDGGYIVTGLTGSFVSPGNKNNVFLLKISSEGVIEWNRSYGGIYWDQGQCVRQTPD